MVRSATSDCVMPARSRRRFSSAQKNASGLEYGSVATALPGFLHVIARFHRPRCPGRLRRSRYRWPGTLAIRFPMPEVRDPAKAHARNMPLGSRTMPTEPVTVEPLKHPLHALTMYELKDRRRELERAINGISPDAPVQADLRRQLDAVIAEQEDRARPADA